MVPRNKVIRTLAGSNRQIHKYRLSDMVSPLPTSGLKNIYRTSLVLTTWYKFSCKPGDLWRVGLRNSRSQWMSSVSSFPRYIQFIFPTSGYFLLPLCQLFQLASSKKKKKKLLGICVNNFTVTLLKK